MGYLRKYWSESSASSFVTAACLSSSLSEYVWFHNRWGPLSYFMICVLMCRHRACGLGGPLSAPPNRIPLQPRGQHYTVVFIEPLEWFGLLYNKELSEAFWSGVKWWVLFDIRPRSLRHSPHRAVREPASIALFVSALVGGQQLLRSGDFSPDLVAGLSGPLEGEGITTGSIAVMEHHPCETAKQQQLYEFWIIRGEGESWCQFQWTCWNFTK